MTVMETSFREHSPGLMTSEVTASFRETAFRAAWEFKALLRESGFSYRTMAAFIALYIAMAVPSVPPVISFAFRLASVS